MQSNRFYPQVKLMLRCIPAIAQETCFALKGGTAINLFVRDMPRLSVDIDLAYIPLESREVSLANISAALQRISQAIKKSIPNSKIQETKSIGKDPRTIKLVVSHDEQTVVIEPNEVIRGSVFGTKQRSLVEKAEKTFEMSAKISVLELSDLYGGKLCAAVDRQHPRDIFDVKILMENEGITDEIRKAFIVYLAGHPRPMNELIDPPRKNIAKIYESDFVDMAETSVTLDELIKTRETYIQLLKKEMTNDERQFLLSLKQGSPDWALLGVSGVEKLPSIQWKLANIQKMDSAKHKKSIAALKAKLDL